MNDLRLAIRHLLRAPGFTALAVVTLGLGIGLVSTQYSLMDGVLIRPLPFADSDRLYHAAKTGSNGGGGWQTFTLEEYLALREQQTALEGLAAFQDGNFNLSPAGSPPRRLQGLAVSAGFFRLLRMNARLGRVFEPGEDGSGQPLLVVLSHGAWRDEFGGEAEVVGRAVRINGEMGTVIGVMPEGFSFPGREECWVNLRLDPGATARDDLGSVQALGMVKAGFTKEQAAADLEVILNRHRAQAGTGEAGARAPRVRLQPIQRAHTGDGTVALLGTLQMMTICVLALACGNVANLMLVRVTARMRDLAVHTALGAARGRMLRQWWMEGVLISLLGAAVGWGMAWFGVGWLERQVITRMDVASWIHFDLNPRVLGVTMIAAVVSGMVAGTWPALRVARLDPMVCLRGGSRDAEALARRGWARWLVSGQMAFASALVVAAGLLALSAWRSSRVNLTFDPGSLLLGRIELLGERYGERESRSVFYDRLLSEVAALPGVAAVAVSSRDLVSPAVYSGFELDGEVGTGPGGQRGGWLEVVSRDYFRVVNRRASQGRLFEAGDRTGSPGVALVNESFAAKHFGETSPLGRRIRRDEAGAEWATIVGVVPDLNMEGVGNRDPAAGWYLLQDQQAWGWLDLLVRAEGDPAALVSGVRRAVAAVDPEQPVHTVSTLGERTARQVAGLEIVGSMAVVFAATALVMAGVGSYGVMSHGVRRRRREFGVRMALGSTGWGVVGLVMRQEGVLTVGAIGVGLGLGRLLAVPFLPYLPLVEGPEPAVQGGIAVVLGGVGFLALYLPARWAARLDPMTVLRSD